MEGWAEYYSVDLSEKIGRGLTENALKGKMNGGGLTFGYRMKDQRLEIDETTAPVVMEIFTRYADGERMTDIAKDLTRRGIRTSQGNKITLNVVHYLLKNRRYIGEYKFRDMIIPDAIPPIVSEELFNRVQEITTRNQKAPAMRKAEDDYILTTRLFCGKCGTLMVGESGKSHTGIVHRYYKCSHAKRKMGCDKKPVKKDWIEDAVIHYIMKIVMDDELIDHIADAILNILAQENSKLPQLNARLKEIESGIQNMLNAIQQGILTPSTKERLEALEREREEIKVAIYSEELQKPKITKEHIAFWISKFRDTDLTDVASRKRLVESFVNAVFVYDDKVVFTFNYKDGSKTATIDEINAELGSDLDGTSPPRAPVSEQQGLLMGALFFGGDTRGVVGRQENKFIYFRRSAGSTADKTVDTHCFPCAALKRRRPLAPRRGKAQFAKRRTYPSFLLLTLAAPSFAQKPRFCAKEGFNFCATRKQTHLRKPPLTRGHGFSSFASYN